jgi:hypothetical protein
MTPYGYHTSDIGHTPRDERQAIREVMKQTRNAERAARKNAGPSVLRLRLTGMGRWVLHFGRANRLGRASHT